MQRLVRLLDSALHATLSLIVFAVVVAFGAFGVFVYFKLGIYREQPWFIAPVPVLLAAIGARIVRSKYVSDMLCSLALLGAAACMYPISQILVGSEVHLAMRVALIPAGLLFFLLGYASLGIGLRAWRKH